MGEHTVDAAKKRNRKSVTAQLKKQRKKKLKGKKRREKVGGEVRWKGGKKKYR